MSLELFIVRRGVAPAEYVGRLLEIPEPPAPEQLAALGLDLRTPDLRARLLEAVAAPTLHGLGAPTRVVPYGLVEPTAWERAYVDFVAGRLGLAPEPGWDRAQANPAMASLAAGLVDPLAAPPTGAPVDLLAGDDQELEALGAARAIRRWLAPQPPERWAEALAEVIILLPGAGHRRALWRQTLERHGLAAIAPDWQPLSETPFGLWLQALAHLAGWGRGKLRARREHLRTALLSPFVAMPPGAQRRDLRTALRTLRANGLALDTWKAHLAAFFDGLADEIQKDEDLTAPQRKARLADVAARRAGLATLTDALAKALAPADEELFAALAQLAKDVRSDRIARASGVEAAATSVTRGVRVLQWLASEPSPDAATPLHQRLREALDGALRLDAPPVTGVRVLTYGQWDGRPARLVVLAGLEEGGWPAAPPRRSREAAALAEALGLEPAEVELERRTRVAAAAAVAAQERVVLTWSRTDEAGSQTFAGPLLAALRGTEAAPGLPEQQVGEPAASVGGPADLHSPADLAQAPWPAVGRALRGEAKSRWTLTRQVAEEARARDAARAPARRTPIGPFTGEVGAPVARDTYSPTALEALGQCGMRYFLQRVLGLKAQGEAGVDLEAMEVGNLLHEGLSELARAAIAVKPKAWVLSGLEDPAKQEAHVETIHAELSAKVEAVVAAHAASEPTLSAPLIQRVGDRWKRALRAWLVREVAAPEGCTLPAGGPPAPEDVGAETAAGLTKDAREKLERLKNDLFDEVLVLLASARAKPLTKKEADAAFDAKLRSHLTTLGKGAFREAAIIADKGARVAALAALEEKAKQVHGKYQAEAKAALLQGYAQDRLKVPRRVIATEWSFGEGETKEGAPGPLHVKLGGRRAIDIRGRIDRIDASQDRASLAVVDYKTGRTKGAGELRRGLGAGNHLQLPLYAAAVNELLPGRRGVPQDGQTVLGRLTFPRFAAESVLPLDADVGKPYVLEGDEALVQPLEVLRAHLAHALTRVESGVLPVLPSLCPNDDTKGYCDMALLCDDRTEFRSRLVDPAPQPRFVDPPEPEDEEEGSGALPVHPAYAPASPVQEPPSSAAGARTHAEGQSLAVDLKRDVTLSAGAGSGKTTALVSRYVAALEAGHAPEQLLCITFTRKATAEMRSRVRAALVAPPKGSRIGALAPERRRRWIAGLGAAPIHTFDAFAAVLVNEYDAGAVEVSDRVSDYALEWVGDRLAVEAAKPSKALGLLLGAWPVPKVRATLAQLLIADRPLADHAPGLDAKTILEGWDAEAARLTPGFEAAIKAFAKRAAAMVKAFPAPTKEDANSAEVAQLLSAALDGTLKATQQRGVLVGLAALGRAKLSRKRNYDEDLQVLVEEFKDWRASAAGWFWDISSPLFGCQDDTAVVKHLTHEARLSAGAVSLAGGWLPEFMTARANLRQRTFGEVLARATALVEREIAPEDLAARFPFDHLLVDEFQDTDAAQIRFIDGLVKALRRGGRDTRLFVVGDPKQSIYRFRNAEVDLFEERCLYGQAELGELTTCFRSAPALTTAVDRLFARLFDGRDTDGQPLDPAAAVPWLPLSPRGASKDDPAGPCIELLRPVEHRPSGAQGAADGEAAPDAGSGEADGGALSYFDMLDAKQRKAGGPDPLQEGQEEGAEEADDLVEQATVRRIRGLLAEAAERAARGEPSRGEAPVAVLVHSWDRAVHYGRLLREHGVPAFVQGGRGLLETREVRDLLAWLQALEREDDDLMFGAVLRGGTVGLSDPGLYCLRRGFGLSLRNLSDQGPDYQPADDGLALARLRVGFRFDVEAAGKALARARGEALPGHLAEALRGDAERLERFGRTFEQVRRRFGHVPPLELLDLIVEGTGYQAALRVRDDGRQALANLRAFRELVRSAQEGATPAELVREVERLATAEQDPATAGLNLQPGAAVLVTVVHQAKGREWDVVVLPDLECKGLRDRISACDLVRLVERAGQKWRRRWLPSSHLENPKDLFATRLGVGGGVLKEASRGAERAESRRLLYVAMTRARRKLVVTADWPDAGTFEKWMKKLGRLDLPFARNWLQDVAFALQLAPAAAGLVPGDVWKEGRDFVWVTPPGEGYGTAEPPPAPSEAADSAAIARAALAVTPPRLELVTPSGLKPEQAPPAPPAELVRPAQPLPPQGGSPFPSQDREGIAFHAVMQAWNYTGPCTPALVKPLLDPAPAKVQAARVTRLLELVAALERSQPALLAGLRAAAARGELFHELDLGVSVGATRRIEGAIDLLWKDQGGQWHVLDYKTSQVEAAGALEAKTDGYWPQVHAYAEALRGRLPGGASPASVGLWFVGVGVVVRWRGV